MKILFKFLIVLFSAIALNAAELKHADSYDDAIEQGIKENKRVVLFTHSPFCPWCRKMEIDTFTNKEVIEYLNKNFVFVTADLSLNMEVEDLPSRFIPRGTPTTYVINPKDQSLAFTMRGYKKPSSFIGRLSR